MAEQNPSLTLIKRLNQRTQEGRLTWQESTSEDTFLTPFPDHSIQILKQEHDYETDYALRIFDDKGGLVEEITPGDLSVNMSQVVAHNLMRELFVAARRSAKGADRIVQSILATLGDDDDDDIPF